MVNGLTLKTLLIQLTDWNWTARKSVDSDTLTPMSKSEPRIRFYQSPVKGPVPLGGKVDCRVGTGKIEYELETSKITKY